MKRLFILLGLCLYVAASAFTAMAGALDFPDAIPTSLDQVSTGSGAIVSSDGYILTNNHVIDGATTIEVVLTTGKTYEARVIGVDPDHDLALIKISGSGFPAIPVDAKRVVRVGELAVSIGSPKGYVGTVSSGTITALNRTLSSLGLSGIYQTNADIAPGSSGGPLIDEYGNIIGINVAVSVEGEDHVPITAFGFSIPIGQAQPLLRHVSNIPNLRQDILSVPDIAELCAPATVYIISTKEIPLASLLPSELPGYGTPFLYGTLFFFDSSSWTGCEDVRKRIRNNAPCSWRDDRLWAEIGGSRQLHYGSFNISILLAGCESLEDASRLADTVRESNLQDRMIIVESSYIVGEYSAEVVIGMHIQNAIVDLKWMRGGGEAYVELSGTLTLPTQDFLMSLTLTWRDRSWLAMTDLAITEGVSYLFRDSCVVRELWEEQTFPKLPRKTTTTTLIWLDTFEDELDKLFREALAALAAGL